MLYDTPGMLWPKVENENSGYRLGATGAIRDTALEYEEVASYTAEYLLHAYPELLKARYKLNELPESDWGGSASAGRQSSPASVDVLNAFKEERYAGATGRFYMGTVGKRFPVNPGKDPNGLLRTFNARRLKPGLLFSFQV